MMRARPARLLGVIALTGAAFLLPAAAAQADPEDWVVTAYDVVADIAPDGGAQVTIDLDFDFGNDDEAHGPFLTIVERQEIQGDPDRYRVLEVSDIAVTSDTGAPTDLLVEREDGAVVVRVGDEDVEISGVQSYTVSYHLDSLVTPAAAGGEDVVLWNAVGLGWEVPLENVSVTLRAAAEPIGYACYAGGVGATTPCDQAGADGAPTGSQGRLEPGQGLTVEARYEAGTFPQASVAYAPRRTFGNSFSLTPATGAVGGVTLLGGLAAVLGVRRRRRDPEAAGTVAVDASGHGIPEGFRTEPPDDVPPGEYGTLIDSRAEPHDVVAVLLDLAVRGALHVEALPGGESEADEEAEPDFQLVRVDGPHDLRDYERELLEGIFGVDGERTVVTVSEHGSEIASAVGKAQLALDDTVASRGWFVGSPRKVRARWALGGLGVILLGLAASIVGALTAGWGLVGLGAVVVGVVMICVASSMPTRTALGARTTREAREFERYLNDVTADSPTWEQGRETLVPSIFERYLPYAVALGLEERWTGAFTEAVRRGELGQPDWYATPTNLTFLALWSSGGFSRSIGDLSSGVVSTATTAGTASGGGYTGSVGGGAGGGGGGGW